MFNFFLCCLFLFGLDAAHVYNDFDRNPFVSIEERHAVLPHLLPFEHPIREKLDLIFHRTRATKDINSLVEAGFIVLKQKSRSFIIVATHPDIPGYLFKLHLDSELRLKRGKPGWYWFSQRVIGAKAIGKVITKKKLDLVKCPKKWLYPLPVYPEAPSGEGYSRKNIILVAEYIPLLSKVPNLEAFKTQITKEHLNQICYVLNKCGGNSIRPDNIPFDKKGRCCFIDTEYPGADTRWSEFNKYLNPEMEAYWKSITGQ